MVTADIDFLGEGDEEASTGKLINFKRGITSYPIPGSKVYPVAGDDLKQMFAADDRAHIEIGTVYPTKDVRAALYVDALLGKHFALLGSTGTGKSTSAALIMHRICDMSPEGPYRDDRSARRIFGRVQGPWRAVQRRQSRHALLADELRGALRGLHHLFGRRTAARQDILAKCLLQARGKNRAAEGLSKLTVDSPIPYTLSDLTNAITHEMGLLNKATDTAPFMRLKTKIDELKSDPRYQFMFSGMLVADTMGSFIAKIFRPSRQGQADLDHRRSGRPFRHRLGRRRGAVAAGVRLCDLVARARFSAPSCSICEEAHRYIPSDKNSAGQAVRKILERIAKEGRKYGVSLGLITQRPSDLAEGVLSQCGTIIAMRLNNDRDQAFVKSAMPEGSRGFLDVIPALRNRECIVCGEGVSIPIRVSFDDLERDRCPASSDPLFSELWKQTGEEEAMVARVVKRWRAQGR